MAQQPSVGITTVDRLIQLALERGLQFPQQASRWRLLAWAAEEAALERSDPTDFARDGFRRVFLEHFPPPATPR